jgi:hypothetical protein
MDACSLPPFFFCVTLYPIPTCMWELQQNVHIFVESTANTKQMFPGGNFGFPVSAKLAYTQTIGLIL